MGSNVCWGLVLGKQVHCKSVLPNPQLSPEAVEPHLYVRSLQEAPGIGMRAADKCSEKPLKTPAGTGQGTEIRKVLLPTTNLQFSPEPRAAHSEITKHLEMK